MPWSSLSVGPEEMPTCPGLHCPLSQVQTRKEEPLPPAASRSIPTFYFPRGRPQDTVNVDTVIAKIERTFAQFPHERATMEDMGRVAKVGVPVARVVVLLRARQAQSSASLCLLSAVLGA